MYGLLRIRKWSSTLPFIFCFVLCEFFLTLLVMLSNEACTAISSDFIFTDLSHVDFGKSSNTCLWSVMKDSYSSWYCDALLHYGEHTGWLVLPLKSYIGTVCPIHMLLSNTCKQKRYFRNSRCICTVQIHTILTFEWGDTVFLVPGNYLVL